MTASDRPRVSAAVFRDGHVLMVRHLRRDGSTYWQLPGGGVHPGESDHEAVARELHEETGLTGEIGRKLFTIPYKYGLSTTYLVTVAEDADPELGADPEEADADHQKLVELAWQPFDTFESRPELEQLRAIPDLPPAGEGQASG